MWQTYETEILTHLKYIKCALQGLDMDPDMDLLDMEYELFIGRWDLNWAPRALSTEPVL